MKENLSEKEFEKIFENTTEYRNFLKSEEKKESPKMVVFFVGVGFILLAYFFWYFWSWAAILPVFFIFLFGALAIFSSLSNTKTSDLSEKDLRKSLEKRKEILNWMKNLKK